MPSETYKLLYMNVRAFGEPIRLFLHYKGIEFEDVRFDRNGFYHAPELKKLTPYGKVPVLIINDKPIAQSGAILRHLARKFDLNGKNEEEVTKTDELLGFIYDCFGKLNVFPVVFAGLVPGNKDELFKEYFLPTVEYCLPIMSQLLKSSGSGYFLPSGLTYVDFTFAEFFNTLAGVDSSQFDKYPELLEHMRRVHSLPGIREYVEKRPKYLH
ncbi:hypothetical protein M3Y98_01153300 [Aphelenchoides besseyi]|nr:hypothetical protein M3Y98_01153300 [Aphelenchoides besseyi]KAI6210797.1 hypothetical protein M3Y96_00366300 [Aphelenchoides besseyi]